MAHTTTEQIPTSRMSVGADETAPSMRLASSSPRRAGLLALTGLAFETCPTEVDETPLPGEAPEALVRRLAETKAASAAQATGGSLVIAADTEVVLDGRTLGKPADRDQAMEMLVRLRDRAHTVVTAVAVFEPGSGRMLTDTCETRVVMRPYTESEVTAYVDTDAPMDKAGGYGIQDEPFNPVDMRAMRACYANVMGLPLCHLTRLLRRIGRAPTADIPQMCRQHTGYPCEIFPVILQESG